MLVDCSCFVVQQQASGSVTDDYDVTVKQLAFDGRAQVSAF